MTVRYSNQKSNKSPRMNSFSAEGRIALRKLNNRSSFFRSCSLAPSPRWTSDIKYNGFASCIIPAGESGFDHNREFYRLFLPVAPPLGIQTEKVCHNPFHRSPPRRDLPAERHLLHDRSR